MATTLILNPFGSTEVWNVSTQTWNVTTAMFFGEVPAPNLLASGSNVASANIGVSGVPEISVNRDSNGATISLISTNKYDLRIYRANDHRELFYRYVDSVVGDYSDNGIWNTYAFEWDSNNVDYDEYSESKNYKYKASFMATATIGGNTVEVESQTSEPVYTVGNKTL